MKNIYLIRLAIIAALFTQISHAAYAFNKLSHDNLSTYGIICSYIFAFSLELSIYLFTIFGKKLVATFFCFVSILINILYYWYVIKWDFNFVGSMIISIIIPITIWCYADLIDEDLSKDKKKTKK